MLDRRILIAAAGALMLPAPRARAAGVPPAAVSGDMSLGDPKAKVRVVEYASASCPHCARFATEVFPAFKARYVDTGRVYYTLKEYLTPPAQVAAIGFLIARCGGPAKYFPILDDVFRSQAEWAAGGDVRKALLAAAAKNGVSEAQVLACVDDKAAIEALNARVKQAFEVDKITSTPTFVINGQQIVGETTLATLDDAIAKAAASAPAKKR